MSEFEFVFALFGLLLGFSLVEVLGGLARTLEKALRIRAGGKGNFRAGWLTPLLGIFVMLDILSFWGSGWAVRDQVHATGPYLLGGLAFAGAYYLAAHLVFPGDPGAVRNLDDHYFAVRRPVFAALLVLALIQIGWFATFPGMAAYLTTPRVGLSVLLLIGMMVAVMFVRNRLASAILLSALSVRYVVEAIL